VEYQVGPEDRKTETAEVADTDSSEDSNSGRSRCKGVCYRRKCCQRTGALLVGLGVAGFFGGLPAVLGVGAAAAIITISCTNCRERCVGSQETSATATPLAESMLKSDSNEETHFNN